MTSLYVHPRLGEVTLSQTVRARRISISVRATGAVRLSFPCGVPQKRALDFLEQKAEWIGAARERLARKRIRRKTAVSVLAKGMEMQAALQVDSMYFFEEYLKKLEEAREDAANQEETEKDEME